jgi:hypothetical protein
MVRPTSRGCIFKGSSIHLQSQEVLSGTLICIRNRLPHAQAPFVHNDCNATENLRLSEISKACILQANTAKGQTGLLYCGNYKYTKVLLSRFSWQIGSKMITFFDFTLRLAYRYPILAHQEPITAIDKWQKALNLPFAASWPIRVAYINDPVLSDRTKEKLYKIITRASLVGRKFANSSSISSACAFCNIMKDELHCFILCARLAPLWRWLFNIVSHVYPWVLNIMDVENMFGYTTKVQHDDLNEQIWKVLHAETIRVIWYARCSKVFKKESPSMEALKGMIRYCVQTTFSLYAASPRAAQDQIQAWLNAFPCNTPHSRGRFKLHIPL